MEQGVTQPRQLRGQRDDNKNETTQTVREAFFVDLIEA